MKRLALLLSLIVAVPMLAPTRAQARDRRHHHHHHHHDRDYRCDSRGYDGYRPYYGYSRAYYRPAYYAPAYYAPYRTSYRGGYYPYSRRPGLRITFGF